MSAFIYREPSILNGRGLISLFAKCTRKINDSQLTVRASPHCFRVFNAKFFFHLCHAIFILKGNSFSTLFINYTFNEKPLLISSRAIFEHSFVVRLFSFISFSSKSMDLFSCKVQVYFFLDIMLKKGRIMYIRDDVIPRRARQLNLNRSLAVRDIRFSLKPAALQADGDYKTFIAQLPTSGHSLLICIKIGEQGEEGSESGEKILNTRSDYDFAGE